MSMMNLKYKLAIVIRTDLKMDKGKMCAQAAHAAVDCALYASHNRENEVVGAWKIEGQRKIVLKVDSEKAIQDIAERALNDHIYVSVIRDFGLTQVPHGTLTCIGIGPHLNEKIDKYVYELKLL